MIEIKGQYVFSATIGDIKDFIALTDLVYFSIEESCGNVPPTFKFEFKTDNDKILSRLNEGNPIQVQFGETLESYDSLELYTSDFSFKGDGEQVRVIADGFAFQQDYNVATRVSISDKVSGVALLKSRLAGLCTPVFNVNSSADSQNWIQNGIPDRQFFNQLICRSYSPDSFFLSAITSDKKFILKDVKKESILKATKPDWIFSKNDLGTNVVPYSGNYDIRVAGGLMSSIAGYGRQRVITKIQEGDTTVINQIPKPYLALTKEIIRKASIEKKFVGSGIQTANMHANYHQAYLNFIVNTIMLGAISISVNFDDRYRKIKPADWVMFKGESKRGFSGASEYTSGFYIVSKVTRTIKESDMRFDIELGRESFNQTRTI